MKKLVLLAAIAGLTFLQFTHDTLADVSMAGFEQDIQGDEYAHPNCWRLLHDILSTERIYLAKLAEMNELLLYNPNHPDVARLRALIDNIRTSLRTMREQWAALGCSGRWIRDPKNPDAMIRPPLSFPY
ncbi:MAG: hypothetical protein AB7F82_07070 [Alphaproteobacteria bacterium]